MRVCIDDPRLKAERNTVDLGPHTLPLPHPPRETYGVAILLVENCRLDEDDDDET